MQVVNLRINWNASTSVAAIHIILAGFQRPQGLAAKLSLRPPLELRYRRANQSL